MIRVVGPGAWSGIRIQIFYPSRIPDPGSNRHRIPDPQHCIFVKKHWERCFAGKLVLWASLLNSLAPESPRYPSPTEPPLPTCVLNTVSKEALIGQLFPTVTGNVTVFRFRIHFTPIPIPNRILLNTAPELETWKNNEKPAFHQCTWTTVKKGTFSPWSKQLLLCTITWVGHYFKQLYTDTVFQEHPEWPLGPKKSTFSTEKSGFQRTHNLWEFVYLSRSRSRLDSFVFLVLPLKHK